MTDFKDRLLEAFRRGERERAAANDAISRGLTRIKAALEATALGLSVEPSDYDGLFIRVATRSLRRDAGYVDTRPGWWAYLVVNTTPDGLTYTVRGGFGRKNEPDSLKDVVPDRTAHTVDEALELLEDAVERGLYYVGTLKK